MPSQHKGTSDNKSNNNWGYRRKGYQIIFRFSATITSWDWTIAFFDLALLFHGGLYPYMFSLLSLVSYYSQ